MLQIIKAGAEQAQIADSSSSRNATEHENPGTNIVDEDTCINIDAPKQMWNEMSATEQQIIEDYETEKAIGLYQMLVVKKPRIDC